MNPWVAVVMGSRSDWTTMSRAAEVLDELALPHDVRVLSAHRTPDELSAYIAAAEQQGVKVFIAGAGGAAHLAGVIAAKTVLPVLGVPIQSEALRGLDSLLSTVQMPAGIPVGTLAIGPAGAANAALLAAAIIAIEQPQVRQRLQQYRQQQAEKVLEHPDPRKDEGKG